MDRLSKMPFTHAEMTEETHFAVEVRRSHLHTIGQESGETSEFWSDALYEFLPDAPKSVHADVTGARDVARLLRDVAGIPMKDIRITQVCRKTVDIDETEKVGVLSDATDGLRLYRWRSEALRRYGCGHAFAMGGDVDEARSAAMLSFRAYLASEEWWGTGPEADGCFRFEDDREEYEAAILKFQADLDADPLAVGAAFLVLGSE